MSSGAQRGPFSSHPVAHAAIVFGSFTALYSWLFCRGIIDGTFLADSDLYEYHLPIFRAPLTIWSNFEFAGFPAFADPQNATWYPFHLLFSQLAPSWTAFIVSAYVLGACFTYGYVFGITRSRLAAVVSALGFALGEALMAKTAHAAVLHSIIWLPLVLLSIDKIRDGTIGDGVASRWVGIGALGIAGCVLGGHPQFAMYSLYCALLYAGVGGVTTRSGRPYYVAVTAMIAIGGLLAAVQVIPFLEASFETARTTVSFSQFASHARTPSDLLTLPVLPVIPHEGREAPLYVGLGVLVLALIGATRWRHEWRYAFWLAVVAGAVLLGLGSATPAAAVAFKVPLYAKFRLVVRHLYLAGFGMSVLAGGGVIALRSRQGTGRVVASLIAVCAMLALAIARHWPLSTSIETEVDVLSALNTLPILGGGVWAQVILMAVTSAAILASRIPKLARIGPAVLVAIIAVDLINSRGEIDARGLDSTLIRAEELLPSVHARELARSAGFQRLVALGGSSTDALIPGSMPRLWHISSAGAYNAMLLDRHHDVAQMGNDGSIRPETLRNADVGLDVLAIRYVIVRAQDLEPGPGVETAAQPSLPLLAPTLLANRSRWREQARFRTSRRTDRSADGGGRGEEEYVVYENLRAQPRAWIVDEAVPLARPDALQAIRTSKLPDGRRFVPGRMALVETGAAPDVTRFETGRADARVERIEDGLVAVSVNTDHGGYLVLSDTNYPGWHATIDGAEAPVYRTDISLRGVVVPAGQHAVLFSFAPTSLYVGGGLSAMGVLLIVGLLLQPLRSTLHGGRPVTSLDKRDPSPHNPVAFNS